MASRSLKVKHFRVTGKPTKHFMKPHNNTDFTSKGSKGMALQCRHTRLSVLHCLVKSSQRTRLLLYLRLVLITL